MQDYRAAYAGGAPTMPVVLTASRKFLQTYPASENADDATYWLADCYFKSRELLGSRAAVFDDVARQYPKGTKRRTHCIDREALLRMGHAKAAGNAFEKVLATTPGSARAPEASASSICSRG
jgi:TolA-binding protein